MKVTLDIDDPEAVLYVLAEASIEFSNENAPKSRKLIDGLRKQIKGQLPKRPEPTGDCVVVDRNGTTWRREGMVWRSREGTTNWTALSQWDPVTYRPVREMTDAEIAAHTSAVVGDR